MQKGINTRAQAEGVLGPENTHTAAPARSMARLLPGRLHVLCLFGGWGGGDLGKI